MTELRDDRNREAWSSIARSTIIQPGAGLEHPVHLAPQSEIHNGSRLGRCSFVNIRSVIYPNVEVGRYCSIARNCEVGVAAHPVHYLSTHSFQYNPELFPGWPEYCDMERNVKFLAHKKTLIGNDVWIGAQVIVIAGVKIGDGAVVAANSVVTNDVDPYSIVLGSPARHMRFRFDPEQIEELLWLKWWDFPIEMLSSIRFDDIDSAIRDLKLVRKRMHAPGAAPGNRSNIDWIKR